MTRQKKLLPQKQQPCHAICGPEKENGNPSRREWAPKIKSMTVARTNACTSVRFWWTTCANHRNFHGGSLKPQLVAWHVQQFIASKIPFKKKQFGFRKTSTKSSTSPIFGKTSPFKNSVPLIFLGGFSNRVKIPGKGTLKRGTPGEPLKLRISKVDISSKGDVGKLLCYPLVN